MAKTRSGSDFFRNLNTATAAEKVREEGLDRDNALSEQESSEWKSSESADSDTLAEIKKAQALSDEKFSKLKRRLLKGQIQLQKQDTKMRREYASKAYLFVWAWSIALILVIFCQGFNFPATKIWLINLDVHGFKLDDKVVIALITGVTVNIVAVFIVVMRNLFPSDYKPKNAEDKKPENDK